MADRTLPPAVLTYATPGQLRLLEAAARHPTDREAAAELGVDRTTITHARTRCRRRAAEAGVAPDVGVDHPQPVGQAVGGLSTLYKLDPTTTGGAVLRWVKTRPERAAMLEAMREACDEIAGTVGGLAEPAPAPELGPAELCNVVEIGDHHFGCYADERETGAANYDTREARRLLEGAVSTLLDRAPAAASCVIVSVGDYVHADGGVWQTSRSGHHLDGDTRYIQVCEVALATMLQCVRLALRTHDRVRVIMASGNHDDKTSPFLAMAVRHYFDREPRVEVDNVYGGRYHYHEHGACLLGVTHGDTCKPTQLGEVMACDRPEAWGRSKLRHWITGHVHHKSVIAGRQWTAETLETLAPADAWAAAAGYRSGRSCKVDTYHAAGRRVCTHYVTPEEIAA